MRRAVLVQLADRLDWTEMEVRAEEIRASRLKNAAGRPDPDRRSAQDAADQIQLALTSYPLPTWSACSSPNVFTSRSQSGPPHT